MGDEDPKAKPRKLSDEVRSAARLVVDATKGATHIVEEMHQEIGGGPPLLGRPFLPFVKLFSGPVYASIRGITELVGIGLDAVLAELAPAFDKGTPPVEVDAVRAALNGVLGDRLAEHGSPLAIPLALRARGHDLVLERGALAAALDDATGRVVVLVHGSAMDDAMWTRGGTNHGETLARELGMTTVTVRYNSGLHVSENGRALDAALERLVAEWPVALERLVVVGFSMGGLVARSAVHFAEAHGHAWRRALTALVFLGTPHHGAPLERVGNVLDLLLDVSRFSAPLGALARIRSAGVTDLRYGNVLDEHWQGRDRFALEGDPRQECSLPDGVPCFAVAASMTPGPSDDDAPPSRHELTGDGLVPVDSALGRHDTPARDLHIPLAHQRVVRGARHLDLLSRDEVGHALVSWLGPLVTTTKTTA